MHVAINSPTTFRTRRLISCIKYTVNYVNVALVTFPDESEHPVRVCYVKSRSSDARPWTFIRGIIGKIDVTSVWNPSIIDIEGNFIALVELSRLFVL